MSRLLIFQAAWIVQHLILYHIDTNIIISHIFHSHSLTLCYILILFTVCHLNSTCHFQTVLIFFSFLKFLFCFFFLLTLIVSSRSILPPYLVILSNLNLTLLEFNSIILFRSLTLLPYLNHLNRLIL